jgi:universal stress protein A
MLEIKKILVPTDFSDASDLALRYGYELAQHFAATLLVAHIADDPMLFFPTTSDDYRAEWIGKSIHRMEENLIKVLGTREGIELVAQCGSAATEIVDLTKQQGVHLVVMGSHGRSAMASMLLGNTAEHVVRHSPCPVTTVRWPEHRF